MGQAHNSVYDATGKYIQSVDFLDLIFDIWLGSEMVQHVQCYCVTTRLWNYLMDNGIQGVSVRPMTVTPGDELNELHPGRTIPEFKELLLPRGLQGQQQDGWKLKKSCVPTADMFTGPGLPLFVSENAKELLVQAGVSGVEFALATVSDE